MKKKIGLFLFFTVYLLIILFRLANHFPWFDEAHAWTIAQETPLNQLLSVIRTEGHPFLWYFMLMPFAKTNFLYPYSMYFLNTGFLLLAIYVLWKKSPFNTLTKILITLSYPFFALYPIIARNYSIGIFLLFLLTANFKDKFKHPLIYALCILLCLNSSLMAFFGASIFAGIFLYEAIKKNTIRQNLYGILIIIFGFLLFAVQFCSKSTAINLALNSNLEILSNLFMKNSLDINILLLLGFSIATVYYIIKNKLWLPAIFLGLTYLCLTATFIFIYPAGIWHSYFYYVYFIIAIWLTNSNKSRFGDILLCIISFLLIFNYPTPEVAKTLYGNKGLAIYNTIIQDDTLKNAHLIHNNGTVYTILPLTKKNNINLANYCNNNNYDLKTIKANNKICKHDDGINQARGHFKEFASIIDKQAILITTDRYDSNKYIISDKKTTLYFEKYKCKDEFCYWKVYKF